MARSVSVLLASSKMAVATMCSRLLGLVREQFMAALFGASGLTDAFLVAYRIPNLLRDLFAEGAFSSAFVPTFVEANTVSREEGRKLLWRLFFLLLIITSLISLFIFVFAHEIITIFAPAFTKDPEKFLMTVNLTKIMAPFLTFVSIAALFMGALNSLKVFFIPALAPAFFNVVMIGSMVFFPSYFVSKNIAPIYSLGAGVFIGGLVQALVQFPFILKYGLTPLLDKKLWGKREKKVVTLIGPGLVGFAAVQVNLLINTILASSTVVGAVSWLSYSFRLFQLPVGILSVSIGNSNLVHFSSAWKSNKKDEAINYLSTSFFLSFFVILPAALCLFVFSDLMVNVIFERGRFTSFSTLMTAKALRWYAFGLPFYGLNKILVPTFYAIDRQKIPVLTSLLSIGVNIVFCLSLTPHYGFEILAMGTSLSVMVNALLQAFILKNDLKLNISKFINIRFFKLFLAALASFILSYWFNQQFYLPDLMFAKRCTILIMGILILALCYLICILMLGEKKVVKNFLRSRRR